MTIDFADTLLLMVLSVFVAGNFALAYYDHCKGKYGKAAFSIFVGIFVLSGLVKVWVEVLA